jgi:Gas vesicle synthesis protein GvpO
MADPNSTPTPPLHQDRSPGDAAAALPDRPARERAPARRQVADLVARAKEQLHGLIGYKIDNIASFNKADRGWHLAVTVIELHRIPAATDVLAEYDVDLDENGNLTGYHRGKRYYRDQVGENG